MSENVFTRIADAAHKLNTQAHEVSLRVRETEDRLERAQAGFEVVDAQPFHVRDTTYTPGSPDEDPPFGPEYHAQEAMQLMYCRHGLRWRICVRVGIWKTACEGEPLFHDASIKPLLDCDRHTRLRAVNRLPLFLEHIAAQLEKAAKNVN